MNNRTKLMSAAGGVLLLAGVGGALALWSDDTTGDSLLAATGYLNVNMEDTNTYVWDISKLCQPTVTDGAAPVWKDCSIGSSTPGPTQLTLDEDGQPVGTKALESFKLVPGDTIRVVAPIDVDLSGQNIAAKLTAELGDDELDGVDASSTAVTSAEQFSVHPVGIYGGDPYWTSDTLANATAALEASKGATPDDQPVFYFQGKDDPTTVYAVIDIQFLDLDNGSSTVVDGANDADGNNAADDQDLMEVSALELISAINAQLIQVRS